jgi:DASS family divalent anion:Na+ symporter
MGPMGRNEKIVTAVFVCVCGLWTTTSIHKLDVTITALLGGVVLLLTGVLEWEEIKNEKAAWDIFVWYGGVLRLGKALGDTGVMTELAKGVSSLLPGAGWLTLFAVALLLYFYASYGFASITAHLLAMFPAFLAILTLKGAPLGLMVYAFACFANLGAGLTHYGTVPGPMYFALDYVSLKKWWLIGLPVSLVNLLIWSTVGFAWWKLLGIW